MFVVQRISGICDSVDIIAIISACIILLIFADG